MSMGYDDLLEELELLPQWRLRKPPAQQQAAVVHVKPETQAETSATAVPCRLIISENASMVLVLAPNQTSEAEQLLGNLLNATGFSIQEDIAEGDISHLGGYQDALVVIMGAELAQLALARSDALNHLREQVHVYQDSLQTVVTYSLDDLLENPQYKSACWQDFCAAQLTIDNLKSKD